VGINSQEAQKQVIGSLSFWLKTLVGKPPDTIPELFNILFLLGQLFYRSPMMRAAVP
jgi:hypothetical protein